LEQFALNPTLSLPLPLTHTHVHDDEQSYPHFCAGSQVSSQFCSFLAELSELILLGFQNQSLIAQFGDERTTDQGEYGSWSFTNFNKFLFLFSFLSHNNSNKSMQKILENQSETATAGKKWTCWHYFLGFLIN